MMIRILLILILVCYGIAFAQPQAPVEWGNVEIFHSDPEWPAAGITAMGDTIILHSVRDTIIGLHYPALRITGDGGITWSPWHVFTEDESNVMESPVTFASDGIYCITVHDRNQMHHALSRSTDSGWTWEPPCRRFPIMHLLVARQDTIFCRYGAYSVIRTTDGGCTYTDSSETGLQPGIASMAVGGGWIHVLATPLELGNGKRLYYTRAPISTGIFEEPRDLHADIFWTHTGHLECDEEGTVIIQSPVNWEPPQAWLAAQMVDISHDFGATWTERDTLEPLESCDFGAEQLGHDGSRWLAVWVDSLPLNGYPDGGLHCKFSANRGRSWYPQQQFEDEDFFLGGVSDLDLRGSWLRVYASFELHNNWPDQCSIRWQGLASEDSIAPLLSEGIPIPEYVPCDTLLPLGVTATDNDSLWLMQFVARRMGSGTDSLVFNLARGGNSRFSGQWNVPGDTVVWLCYYRAEDMWENVSYVPPQGPANPWVMHVGTMSAIDPLILHPLSFILSIYPNPSNVWPRIELAEEWFRNSSVRVTIYDVLGRTILEENVRDARVSIGSDQMIATGIYFVRAEAGDRAVMKKFLVIR